MKPKGSPDRRRKFPGLGEGNRKHRQGKGVLRLAKPVAVGGETLPGRPRNWVEVLKAVAEALSTPELLLLAFCAGGPCWSLSLSPSQ